MSKKKMGIGIYGPSLDKKGNCIAGCELLGYISEALHLHIFDTREWNVEDPNHKPNLDMLIENFDRALSHPDKTDLEKLQKSVLR